MKEKQKGRSRPIGTFTEAEVSQILGMLHRGDRQTDIAVYWQTAPGTINRLKHRRIARFKGVQRAETNLPPPGPYTLVEKSNSAQDGNKIMNELINLFEKNGYIVYKSVYNTDQ